MSYPSDWNDDQQLFEDDLRLERARLEREASRRAACGCSDGGDNDDEPYPPYPASSARAASPQAKKPDYAQVKAALSKFGESCRIYNGLVISVALTAAVMIYILGGGRSVAVGVLGLIALIAACCFGICSKGLESCETDYDKMADEFKKTADEEQLDRLKEEEKRFYARRSRLGIITLAIVCIIAAALLTSCSVMACEKDTDEHGYGSTRYSRPRYSSPRTRDTGSSGKSNGSSGKSNGSSGKSLMPSPSTKYFSDPEDFYEYYYDDFWDYEEAEEYYYSHGGQ